MALNDVKFVTTAGGLGRLPVEKDYVSAIIMPLSAAPTNWGSAIGKRYLSLDEAEGDGITQGDATYGLLWYFIKEFFRVAGPSELYVINASDDDFDAQHVYALSEGEIRQAYWYTDTNYAGILAQVGTIKTFVNAMEALFAPLVVLTSIKDETTAVDGSSQPDIRTANSPEVAVINSGSATGDAATLATSLGVKYIPAGGAILGALAFGKVHESLAWVNKFNLQQGDEMQKVALSDATEFNQVSSAALTALNDKGYVFLRKHQGIAGSYVNDTHTGTLVTSDFAYLENVRTIQKAKRLVRTALLPQLSGPLTVDDDGKLSASSVVFYQELASEPLERMQAAGELSNYTVTIDPDQDVLSTSKLNIKIRIQPRGVARIIEVNIGLAASL